jgi:hypothetical protein
MGIQNKGVLPQDKHLGVTLPLQQAMYIQISQSMLCSTGRATARARASDTRHHSGRSLNSSKAIFRKVTFETEGDDAFTAPVQLLFTTAGVEVKSSWGQLRGVGSKFPNENAGVPSQLRVLSAKASNNARSSLVSDSGT